MPATQPAALSEQASAKKALIAKRRPEVKRFATKRVRADDGTVRAEYPTQEMIRTALPPALRPTSVATISRDLRVEGVFLRNTVRSPCLGPEWKKLRKDYCTATPKNFPASKYAELLVVADESLLHLNFGNQKNLLKRGDNNFLMGPCTASNTDGKTDRAYLPAALSVCRPTPTTSPLCENVGSAKQPLGN